MRGYLRQDKPVGVINCAGLSLYQLRDARQDTADHIKPFYKLNKLLKRGLLLENLADLDALEIESFTGTVSGGKQSGGLAGEGVRNVFLGEKLPPKSLTRKFLAGKGLNHENNNF